MLHTILLFVLTRQLVLLNASLQIIIYPRADNQTILRLCFLSCQSRSGSVLQTLAFSQNRLRINVVFLLLVLHKPSFLFEQLKLLNCRSIHTLVVLIRSRRKIDLRLDNMVQTLLVACSFCTCFFTIQHVVRPAAHLLHQLFRRTYSSKWFNLHTISVFL